MGRGYSQTLLNSKTGELIRNGKIAGRLRPDGYLGLSYMGKEQLAHRVVWHLYYGVWPDELDHINRVKTDNRIENLREVSRGENMQNLSCPHRNNRLGILGVRKQKAKYIAQLSANGVKYYLGSFDSAEEAKEAYLNKKKELHIDTSK